MRPHFSTEEHWAVVTETDDVINKERSGRPPVLHSPASEYTMALKLVKRHCQFSASQLAKCLAKCLRDPNGIELSEPTVLRLLHRWHFHPVHFRKRPLLTQKHREKRLRFAQ